jgi:SAM-dependent methyltransferase
MRCFAMRRFSLRQVPAPDLIADEPELSEVRERVSGVMRQGARATLAKRRAEVSAMFDGVAPRYDLMNDLASLGQDRAWRAEVVAAIRPRPGMTVLDLAAGTGTSSAPFSARGAFVVPVDLSLGMLAEGRRRHPQLPFVAGDALALPFADGVFDAVTISFACSVSRHLGALTELSGHLPRRHDRRLRVLHPRGVPSIGLGFLGAPRVPGCRPIPPPTTTSPSPSWRGPTSRRWPR